MGTFGSGRPKVTRVKTHEDESSAEAETSSEAETKVETPKSTPYYQFINILQGKTGRWIEGETKAHGLYTDGITTCKILCVAGRLRNGKKGISLTHLDGNAVVSELVSEAEWFREITNCVIFHNVEELRIHPPRYWYFKHIFCKEIKQIFKDVEFRELTDDSDGLWIMSHSSNNSSPSSSTNSHSNYNGSNSHCKNYDLKIDLINSKEVPESPFVLINHEDAVSIFALSQTNCMCAEIESEFRMCELYYTGKVIPKDDYQVEYEGKIQSEWDVSHSLCPPLDLHRLMFDGYVFLPMGKHDTQLSDFAKSIFEKLNPAETKSYEQFEKAVAEVLHQLEQQKFFDFPQHELQSWGTDRQTTGLAQNYVQALKLEAYVRLPDEYLAKVGLYRKFNHARELQLIEKAVQEYFHRTCYSSSDGATMFFSFSKFATPEQPYGPFADFFCGWTANYELKKFTQLIRSTN